MFYNVYRTASGRTHVTSYGWDTPDEARRWRSTNADLTPIGVCRFKDGRTL
jgi:hypothetical protein